VRQVGPQDIVDLAHAFRVSSDRAYWKRLELHIKKQQEERDREEDLKTEGAELLDLALSVITSEEIATFKVELDRYDTATVAALQENERELMRVRERLEEQFAEAVVLEDGRRVFKSIDGLRVFDEHGQELSPEVIEPSHIEDHRPRWEHVRSNIDLKRALERQRQELHDYQEKIEQARERLDSGDITRKEFDTMREDLKASMPDAVRRHVPGMEQETAATPAAAPSDDEELDLSAVPTPKGSAPSPL